MKLSLAIHVAILADIIAASKSSEGSSSSLALHKDPANTSSAGSLTPPKQSLLRNRQRGHRIRSAIHRGRDPKQHNMLDHRHDNRQRPGRNLRQRLVQQHQLRQLEPDATNLCTLGIRNRLPARQHRPAHTTGPAEHLPGHGGRHPLRRRQPRHQGAQVLPAVPGRPRADGAGRADLGSGRHRRPPAAEGAQERGGREPGSAGPGDGAVDGVVVGL